MDNKRNQADTDVQNAGREKRASKSVVVDEEKENLIKLEVAIEKAKMLFDDDVRSPEIDEEQWMRICLCSLALCSATLSRNHFGELIGMFWHALRDCVEAKVIPSLREKGNPLIFLSELLLSWRRYKELVCCLARIFEPHDNAYHSSMGLSFKDAALEFFCNEVFEEMHARVLETISFLFWGERHGHEIVPANLVKDTFDFYIESGPRMIEWHQHLEHSLLQEIVQFYSRLSSDWILCDSFYVYLDKVEYALNGERARMSKHLPPLTLLKLLEDVRHVMVDEKASRLVQLFFGF